jgi:conjugative transfer signal peptidase TraF
VERPHLRLAWNVSPSVPLGLYRIVPGALVEIGDVVVVRPPRALADFMDKRHYVERGALLIKPVAARAGARVCRRGLVVAIDGRRVATALRADRLGRRLPTWSGCRTLTRGELFLIAPARPDSFDSRYFGRVPVSAIVGRAVPVWTWN